MSRETWCRMVARQFEARRYGPRIGAEDLYATAQRDLDVGMVTDLFYVPARSYAVVELHRRARVPVLRVIGEVSHDWWGVPAWGQALAHHHFGAPPTSSLGKQWVVDAMHRVKRAVLAADHATMAAVSSLGGNEAVARWVLGRVGVVT